MSMAVMLNCNLPQTLRMASECNHSLATFELFTRVGQLGITQMKRRHASPGDSAEYHEPSSQHVLFYKWLGP
jgi:hypothetical protein